MGPGRTGELGTTKDTFPRSSAPGKLLGCLPASWSLGEEVLTEAIIRDFTIFFEFLQKGNSESHRSQTG